MSFQARNFYLGSLLLLDRRRCCYDLNTSAFLIFVEIVCAHSLGSLNGRELLWICLCWIGPQVYRLCKEDREPIPSHLFSSNLRLSILTTCPGLHLARHDFYISIHQMLNLQSKSPMYSYSHSCPTSLPWVRNNNRTWAVQTLPNQKFEKLPMTHAYHLLY